MKKVILSLAAITMIVTGASALEIAATQKAIAAKVEKEAVGNVNMQNVKIKNRTDVTGSAVAGNTGVMVKGKNVNMKNVNIKNNSKVKNSAVAGNTGVKIKAKNVNMRNVDIKNNTKVKDSAVAGNTGVQVGN